jgi:hypothetical protein
MILDLILDMDTAFFKAAKPYPRATQAEWLASLGVGYV